MSETPGTIARLGEQLKAATAAREPVGALDLAGHDRVLAHVPEDMTVTVESGITLDALQAVLARNGQWLPLDPNRGDCLTIRTLLDENLSGPRRFGYGTARDWLIGLKSVMADGRVIESGGRVVKNVAGYDLHKLLIGARGRLAVIVEATFKVSPLPEAGLILSSEHPSAAAALKVVQNVMQAPVNPVVLDLARFSDEPSRLMVAFAGTRREVEWQREQIASMADWQTATLDYFTQFHRALAGQRPARTSVLPLTLGSFLDQVHPPWLAHAGNGVLFHRTTDEPQAATASHPLSERVRRLFDPANVLSTSG